ncbi:hypothetical protein C8R47DRAFT_1319441, partial [Mycena vitilis]
MYPALHRPCVEFHPAQQYQSQFNLSTTLRRRFTLPSSSARSLLTVLILSAPGVAFRAAAACGIHRPPYSQQEIIMILLLRRRLSVVKTHPCRV